MHFTLLIFNFSLFILNHTCLPKEGLPAEGRPACRRKACLPKEGLPAEGRNLTDTVWILYGYCMDTVCQRYFGRNRKLWQKITAWYKRIPKAKQAAIKFNSGKNNKHLLQPFPNFNPDSRSDI